MLHKTKLSLYIKRKAQKQITAHNNFLVKNRVIVAHAKFLL